MDRIDLLNRLVHQRNYRDYLEIGVDSGDALLRIEAARKTGVDPDMRELRERLGIGFGQRIGGWVRRPLPAFCWTHERDGLRLFETTSDAFFARDDSQFDLVFIDGLHQFDQVLRDFQNAQRRLRRDGCIVLHDCNPLTEKAAERVRSKGNVVWNGDTWKAVYYLRGRGVHITTYDFDHGCAVAFDPPEIGEIPEDDVRALIELPYDVLAGDRAGAVGLRAWSESSLPAPSA